MFTEGLLRLEIRPGGPDGGMPLAAVDIGTGVELISPTRFVAVATKSYTVFGVRPDAVPVYTVPIAYTNTGTLAPPPVLYSRV
jgi:hypothetical protein